MKPYRFAPGHFEQEGWEVQLRRVERWHQRAMRVLDPNDGVAGEEATDFLYAFFQSVYHIRDWLQNSGAASKASLDALMSSRAYHWKAVRAAAGWEGSLYLATRHFAGWYMVNELEMSSEDVAIALATEGTLSDASTDTVTRAAHSTGSSAHTPHAPRTVPSARDHLPVPHVRHRRRACSEVLDP